MHNSFNPTTIFSPKSAVAAIASLMLAFVFTGCSATGPFQPHSAFKQAVLPTGYQTALQNQPGVGAQGGFNPQFQTSNFPPQAFGANAGSGTRGFSSPQAGSTTRSFSFPQAGSGTRDFSSPQAGSQTRNQFFGFQGQPAFPQANQGFGGVPSPFVVGGGTFNSGSC